MAKKSDLKKTKESSETIKDPTIGIDKDFFDKYDLYANKQSEHPGRKSDREELYFSRMVDLFMFAMTNGFNKSRDKKIDFSKRKVLFNWRHLHEQDIDLIRAIVILHDKKIKIDDPEKLLSPKDMVEIIESYANGGFKDFIDSVAGSEFEIKLLELLNKEIED